MGTMTPVPFERYVHPLPTAETKLWKPKLTKLPRVKGIPERSHIFQLGVDVQLFMSITFLPLWHVIRFLALNHWRVADLAEPHERNISFHHLLIWANPDWKKMKKIPQKTGAYLRTSDYRKKFCISNFLNKKNLEIKIRSHQSHPSFQFNAAHRLTRCRHQGQEGHLGGWRRHGSKTEVTFLAQEEIRVVSLHQKQGNGPENGKKRKPRNPREFQDVTFSRLEPKTCCTITSKDYWKRKPKGIRWRRDLPKLPKQLLPPQFLLPVETSPCSLGEVSHHSEKNVHQGGPKKVAVFPNDPGTQRLHVDHTENLGATPSNTGPGSTTRNSPIECGATPSAVASGPRKHWFEPVDVVKVRVAVIKWIVNRLSIPPGK